MTIGGRISPRRGILHGSAMNYKQTEAGVAT